MRLVILHGPPGVGKLTVARELQTLTGYRLFHNHLTVDMVAALFDFQSTAFADVREQIWLDTLTRAAEERLDGVIFTLVFEPTILPGFIDRLEARLSNADCHISYVQLHCSPDEIARRVVQPDRTRFLKTTDSDSVKAAVEKGRYDPPHKLSNNVVIDTTKLSVVDTARQIQQLLEL